MILNALRALSPPAPEVRLTAADTNLTRRFRAEHQVIRADVEQLRVVAQTLGEPGAMDRVRRVHELLTREVWPHEHAEESDLYPALNRVLGGTDPTAPMSRAHAEIALQIARLGRLIDDIGDRHLDEADITDLRDVLYSLHAILRLHTAQEDETYLSLGDTAGASACRLSPGRTRERRTDHPSRRLRRRVRAACRRQCSPSGAPPANRPGRAQNPLPIAT